MQYEDKIRALKSLSVMRQMPERQVAAMAEFLRYKELPDGASVFEEGSSGMSLYFVSTGKVRIFKQAGGNASKDLAVMGPGEFFGEMALIDDTLRSAGAAAVGACGLFELFKGDLQRWLKQNPQQAIQFFTEIVHIQSQRLRKTSSELTSYFDMVNLLKTSKSPPGDFMTMTLLRILSQLDRDWSAAVYIDAEDLKEFAAFAGSDRLSDTIAKASGTAADNAWLDPRTYHVALVARERRVGGLILRSRVEVPSPRQEEIARHMSALAPILCSAMQLQALP